MSQNVAESEKSSLAEASPAIDVRQLSKTYRDGFLWRRALPALRDVSFQVNRGEVFGLLGPNGAGKTTFLKILLGIIMKTSGSATMLSHPAGSRKGRSLVGYLPEQLRMPRHLSGNAALNLYGNLNNVPRNEIRQRREELLELVGLAGRGRDSVAKYSKGMLQRLGFAQAILHRPQLLVLDEPTDGLDPRARAEMRELIGTLRKQGVTVFLNSHILQEVELICDRVAILDRGQLRYCGSVEEIGEFVNQRAGRKQTRITFQLRGEEQRVRTAMNQVTAKGCQIVRCDHSDSQVVLVADFDSQDLIDRSIDELRGHGISIRQLTRDATTLENAFLQILEDTGRGDPSS